MSYKLSQTITIMLIKHASLWEVAFLSETKVCGWFISLNECASNSIYPRYNYYHTKTCTKSQLNAVCHRSQTLLTSNSSSSLCSSSPVRHQSLILILFDAAGLKALLDSKSNSLRNSFLEFLDISTMDGLSKCGTDDVF